MRGGLKIAGYGYRALAQARSSSSFNVTAPHNFLPFIHTRCISNTTRRCLPRFTTNDTSLNRMSDSEFSKDQELSERQAEERYLDQLDKGNDVEDREDREFRDDLEEGEFEEDPTLDDEGTSETLVENGGGTLRLVPDSPSYFTGAPAFYDAWTDMQQLLRKYETWPTVPQSQAPRVQWKTLPQFRMITQGTSVQASKYKKILVILNRLNRIDPLIVPDEVKERLAEFHRPALPKFDQSQKQIIDEIGRAYAVGRRKESAARVYVLEGTGQVLINDKPLADKFKRLHDRESVIWPLMVTDRVDNYNVWATVNGGGTTGQAEALTLGIAKALVIHEPALKAVLRRAGCLSRDERVVERKKHGKLKARKMPAWVKR